MTGERLSMPALSRIPESCRPRVRPDMVDRIVPATTGADRDEVAELLGCRDEAPVATRAVPAMFAFWY